MRIAADVFLQKTKKRQLALEGARLVLRVAELEDALFPKLVVSAQPNLAAAAFADFLQQAPLSAGNDRLFGRCPGRWGGRGPLHFQHSIDGASQRSDGVKSVGRIPAHSAGNYFVQFRGTIGYEDAKPRDWVFKDGAAQFGNRGTARNVEESASSQHFEKNRPESIDIHALTAPEIAIPPQVLLGCGVHWRPAKHAGLLANYNAGQSGDP